METILNITNGDSAIKIMDDANIPGVYLPWRDVLHDGPVPANLSINELSEVRAEFIINQGWGEPKTIRNSFLERDATLRSFSHFSKVILWFEHDLYDQLQILQILDWFSEKPLERTQLLMICTEQYLGEATPEQMKGLYRFEERITEKHLILAKKAWTAFRSPTPDNWQNLLNEDTTVFPFLNDAIRRLLEEYPDCKSGLSRTARKALEIISNGEKRPGRIFGRFQATEERRFMGDSSFWAILHQLLASNPPLLQLPPDKQLTLPTNPDQELSITSAGKEVLAGKRNWLDLTIIDHWIGGVHLTPHHLWCWNPDLSVLTNIKKA